MANGEKDFRLGLGSALLRSYKEDWTPRTRDIDSFVDEISRTVPGISPEELTRAKEGSARYKRLSKDIKKMEEILAGMTEEQLFIIDFYHWGAHSVDELAEIFSITPRTMYRWIDAIERKVYVGWYGEWRSDELD